MRAGTYIAFVAATACALMLSGCGSKAHERASGGTLTIYESLPREGATARTADAVAAGARLALADAGGRAGGRRVRLVDLDSARPDGETWDPATVEANAKRAADDPTAIAYIGELDEGASAISVPVTNDRGILQVSPGDGLTSLTRDEPGASLASGPVRYYPSGERSFLRLVPNDLLQAAALIDWAREHGARRIAVVQDERLFGRELAAQVRTIAAKTDLTLTDSVEARTDPTTYPALGHRLAAGHPDAVIYTGLGDLKAGQLLAALHRALPRARLYGGSAMATAAPAPPALPSLLVLDPALPPAAYGARGRAVLRRIARQRGAPAPSEALYGYEAMRLVLDAIDAAGRASDDRAAVVRQALRPRRRVSVLGAYAVLAGGDIAPGRFGEYRRSATSLAYLGVRRPPSRDGLPTELQGRLPRR